MSIKAEKIFREVLKEVKLKPPTPPLNNPSFTNENWKDDFAKGCDWAIKVIKAESRPDFIDRARSVIDLAITNSSNTSDIGGTKPFWVGVHQVSLVTEKLLRSKFEQSGLNRLGEDTL